MASLSSISKSLALHSTLIVKEKLLNRIQGLLTTDRSIDEKVKDLIAYYIVVPIYRDDGRVLFLVHEFQGPISSHAIERIMKRAGQRGLPMAYFHAGIGSIMPTSLDLIAFISSPSMLALGTITTYLGDEFMLLTIWKTSRFSLKRDEAEELIGKFEALRARYMEHKVKAHKELSGDILLVETKTKELILRWAIPLYLKDKEIEEGKSIDREYFHQIRRLVRRYSMKAQMKVYTRKELEDLESRVRIEVVRDNDTRSSRQDEQ